MNLSIKLVNLKQIRAKVEIKNLSKYCDKRENYKKRDKNLPISKELIVVALRKT